MFDTHSLIELLADGHFHSGTRLAETLGVSRAAIWKRLKTLENLGLDIFRVPGRGYRLAQPLELLDSEVLDACLARAGLADGVELRVLDETDSTNACLAGVRPRPGTSVAVLAEYQTAGRGRRGRRWVSPYASNLCLSLAWTFSALPHDLMALPLAVAVIAAEVLARYGVQMQLKWPNDLYAEGRKLGGVLVELQGEPAGECVAVIGLGINVNMPEAISAQVDQPWIDLQRLLDEKRPDRSVVASDLIIALVQGMTRFERHGFAQFRDPWRKLDLFRGKEVLLEGGRESVRGRAAGIDDDGALLLEQDGALTRHLSGDVSLRGVA